jgi:hypothetical protein
MNKIRSIAIIISFIVAGEVEQWYIWLPLIVIGAILLSVISDKAEKYDKL